MTDDKHTEQEQTTEDAPDATDSAGQTAPEASDTTASNAETDSGTTESGATDAASADTETASDGDTFDRAYVEDLRKESAGYRTRVRDLEQQLHRLQVQQTGALADPADLPFDAAHLESPEALQAAIDALLADKPHLKARAFAPGGAAQGARGQVSGGVDLLGMLRGMV
ncbi:hypothetical protein [Gordonia sp. N1V]|uniref:hypothetical protein n=1 Tax=Gordonia sp. N1V TaxID=3034163 RepID=UPI0023E1EEAE|nr:hypothetical protein [Gordonia sp. N1V]MDF3283366.1 hypothetical protein [Gordonia sp. N1V]